MSYAGAQEESLKSHVKDLVLEKEIFKGSYGNVYQAVWKGREVAAKRFHSYIFSVSSGIQGQFKEKIQQECSFLKKLDHPNVVKLHTVLFPKGLSPIIITELLHCDLRRYIMESTTSPRIPEMKLICIALDVIEGLNYMHGLDPPVVHRGLATKNILLTVNGNAKIGDLGVFPEMYTSPVPSIPVYAAPEMYPVMARSAKLKYGPMVDIYSFGVVLMAMILGHEPRPSWPYTKDGELISDHVRRKQDISEMGDHFLKELVLWCLENDSKQRPDLKNIKVELEVHKWKVVQRSNSCEADEEIEIEKVGPQPSYDYKLKVIFIGYDGVGKSCLFNRFKNPFFDIRLSIATVGIDQDYESFKYGSKFVHLDIRDTPSQEMFFVIAAKCCGHVHGIFLVCDVTDRKSFQHISRWLDLARKVFTESNALIIIIGNKIDQADKREVSSEEGHALAKSHGLSYMEASALEVGSIEEMFKTMIQLLTRSVDLGSIKIELNDASGKVKLKKMPEKSKTEHFTDSDDDDDNNDDDDGDGDGGRHDDNTCSYGVDDDGNSPIPSEIKARGPRAKLAYKNALKSGKVKVFRARIMLIGRDRAGKTSLKKSFLGLPFDPQEKSTDGIDVNPSKFEFQVDQVKNWKPTDEKLDVSQFLNQLARKVAAELGEEVTKTNPQDDPKETSPKKNERKSWKMKARSDTEISEYIQDEPKGIGSEINQVPRYMVSHNDNESCIKPAIPELMFDPALPPDEFTHLLVQHLEGLNLPTDATAMEHHMTLDLWDFAGQHLYYASYPVFLSPRAVYLLIYNLSNGLKEIAQPSFRHGIHDIPLSNPNHQTNMEMLLSWLITVSTLCSSKPEEDGDKSKDLQYLRPPVFIVGTHADQPHQDIKEMELQIKNEIVEKKCQDHVIRPFYSVDNTQGSSDEGVTALQKRIIEVLKEEPYMGEEIPLRWLNFEKVIDALLSKQIYHLNVEQLQIVARDKCFIADEEEFHIMVNFYHDLGFIIKHGSTVVLKAQWLIDLFRQLITIPHFDKMDPVVGNHWKKVQDTGILSMELVDHVFKKFVRQGIVRDDILNMMEHFDLIAKFSPSSTDVNYFVPGQLKELPDSLSAVEPSSSDPCPLYIHFFTGFVPHGLFSQVVSRTIRWCSEMKTCTKATSASPPHNGPGKKIKQREQSKAGRSPCLKLYLNGARFIIGRQIIHDFILICKKRFIKIVLKQRTQSRQVSADNSTATRVWEFLEETLRNLSRDLSYLRGLQYRFCVECPYCRLQNRKCTNHNQMSCPHEDCLHLLDITQGEPLICEDSLGKILTVDGLKKWSSQRTSQVLCPSTSLDTAQNLHPVGSSGETLKVALLASEWGSSKGGLSTINRTLAILLAKHSTVEVTILIPKGECSEDEKRTATSHNISIREVQHRPGYNDPLDWLSFPPRDLEIDVVVGHSAKLGKQAQVITESHCCKWVQVVHTEPEELAMHKNYLGAIAKGEEKNRAEIDLCKLADLVVAVGPKLAGAFSSYLGSSRRDIFQLTPGTFANLSDVEHTKQERGKFKVLTFGRGDSEDLSLKGYDIAASAVVELNDSSYRLICVGAPDGKQDEVAETLLQRGISRNQLFVRSFVQNRERLKELFCEVDVAIMPSRTEGFGLTALEAMSAGLPILVSRNSGFGEALLGLPVGKSFVIESEDPKEWAKAIAALRQKSRTQRLQEVQTLRTSYEETFSWEEQCQSLVDRMWQMVHENGEQNLPNEFQEVEDGSPSDDEQERLSKRTDSIWNKLRRRLKFDKK